MSRWRCCCCLLACCCSGGSRPLRVRLAHDQLHRPVDVRLSRVPPNGQPEGPHRVLLRHLRPKRRRRALFSSSALLRRAQARRHGAGSHGGHSAKGTAGALARLHRCEDRGDGGAAAVAGGARGGREGVRQRRQEPARGHLSRAGGARTPIPSRACIVLQEERRALALGEALTPGVFAPPGPRC